MADTEKAKIILKGRLDGNQRNRLAKLLNTLYTPNELAEEIGFSKRQVYRVYIPLGLPHIRDKRNRIWINGKSFREWIVKTYKKSKVEKDEGFCLTCKKPVKMVFSERKKVGDLVYNLFSCPNCGRTISRIIKRGKLND